MTLQEIRAAIAALDERRSELDAKIAERRSGGDAGDVLGVFVADADGEPTEQRTRAELVGLTQAEADEFVAIEQERAVADADLARAEQVAANAADQARFAAKPVNVNLAPDPHDGFRASAAMSNGELRGMATTALEARHIPAERAEQIMAKVDEASGGGMASQAEREVLSMAATYSDPEYAALFTRAAQYGDMSEARRWAESRAAITTGTGLAFPIDIDPTFVDVGARTEYSALRERLTVRTGTANVHHVNTLGAPANAFAKAAEATETVDVTPADASVSITATLSQGTLIWSIAAEQDLPNLYAELSANAAKAMADHEADQILTGNNTGANVQGLLEGATLTRDSTDTTAVLDEDDLIDVMQSIGNRYLNNAQWVAANSTYFHLRKLEASGGTNRIWGAQISGAYPSQLFGFDTLVHSGMSGPSTLPSTFTAADDVMIFGDLAQCYRIYVRLGTSAEFVPHLTGTTANLPNGTRGAYISYRWGAGIVDSAACRVIDIA